LASSNAARLKPDGVFVKAKIEPRKWFLAPTVDVRSSDALEDAATEFDVQGLEVDWACLCWDANLRRGSGWEHWRFKGSQWESINDAARRAYLANSYRVLLTRARQGLVVFVPHGSQNDLTRPPALYDGIYNFLVACGFVPLDAPNCEVLPEHDASQPDYARIQQARTPAIGAKLSTLGGAQRPLSRPPGPQGSS
jgi:hypothetical protein